MSQRRRYGAARRIGIGLIYGAAIGVFLYWTFFRETGPSASSARAAAFLIGIMAILGGLAGGFLTRSGWAMVAGAIGGAVVVGILGVLATHHVKGLVYSFFGVPLGAIAVFLYGSHHEWKRASERAMVSPERSGVWDRELDG